MGLTKSSTGIGAADCGLMIERKSAEDKIIALVGNPNVGKSTVFNALTGMNQHTGNWPGKTVATAQGVCRYHETSYIFADLPGTYSLSAHSAEEECARDFIAGGKADAAVIVCDASCMERNMNLVIQTLEIMPNSVVCVNLIDEAEKKGIRINENEISERLGIPVIKTAARAGRGLSELMAALEAICRNPILNAFKPQYTSAITKAAAEISEYSHELSEARNLPVNWCGLRILEGDLCFMREYKNFYGATKTAALENKAESVRSKHGLTKEKAVDNITSCIIMNAEGICAGAIDMDEENTDKRDRRLDKILTGRFTGIPVMIALLAIVFWITIKGANYPSEWLSSFLFFIGDKLLDGARYIGVPETAAGFLISGIYKTVAWIVSVMLPPMAIFFPLFTLLEDSGYLPRIAFNMDSAFKKCSACGKQALTMCMGFGCNAAGVVGCRIIDSPRERLIAMITNSFVPCNGRFPMMIAIITMFFAGAYAASLKSALILTAVILFGVFMTLLISKLLSLTILKGEPSSFTLELPPYRRPQIARVIVRSIFDRTLFVLGRAVTAAAPAGAVIWLMANITVGDATILSHISGVLDPIGRFMGMDGVILTAFILGLPANEIVVPIIIMAYMSGGELMQYESLDQLRTLLMSNGWTWVTAVSVLLFTLMHSPCITTCITVNKEFKSAKWSAAAIIIPLICGVVICSLFANIASVFL